MGAAWAYTQVRPYQWRDVVERTFVNTISFMTANYVARPLNYHMEGGWGQGEARSQHSGQVLAAMGDGSVRGFRNGIDQRTWYLIQSSNDGNTWNVN